MSESEEFIPRNYQLELMKIALEKNTVIFLPTGSGKTFIALLVLKQMGESLLKPYSEGGKISIILVNTVALVEQHAQYINVHTNFEVGKYSGDMNLDFWPRDKWYQEYDKFQVLIMTSQILMNLVNQNYIDLNKVNLLIFDECHRGVSDHSMRLLMKTFQALRDPPRVLGLTATLLNGNCKPFKVIYEVEALETTYHSKVATVEELKTVVGYSTNPREYIVDFRKHGSSSVEELVKGLLTKCVATLKCVKLEPSKIPVSLKDLKPLDIESGPKKLWNLINDLIYHIDTMGVYGGYKATLAHVIQIERIKKHCEDLHMLALFNWIETLLTFVSQKLNEQIKRIEESKAIYLYSSDQINKLITILRGYKHEKGEDLCCIIFTQRRFTAKVIYHILNTLRDCNPEFSHIKPNFMVGNNNNPYNDTREALFVHKQNKKVLESFAKKDINVLVASNVLEEGVDIPKCTLVIKYDAPLDYRSYIQSKGRARHKQSMYYMMVCQEDLGSFTQKYREYQEVEEILNNYLIGKNDERSEPSQEDIEKMYAEDEIPPYYVNGPGSAQVNMTSAISLLCCYCQSLPSDVYTDLAPDWFVRKINTELGLRAVVIILLPTVSKVLDVIEGPPMLNTKLAKRAAALKACIILHKAGELDDHLLPRDNFIKEEEVDYLFSHYPEKNSPLAGSLKLRRIHKKLIPKVVGEPIKPFSTVHLHIIELQPTFNKQTEDVTNSALFDQYFSPVCYGLVTKNPLPTVCDFPIYITLGTINVSLKVNQNLVTLTDADLDSIKRFHIEVFDSILKVLQTFLAFDKGNDPEMMLLVPVTKQTKSIDWTVLRPPIEIHEVDELNNEEKMNMEVTQETHLRKIVSPWYRRDPSTYIVVEVCLNKSAKSPFPNEDYGTFRDYFSSKHNIDLRNPDLPLLLVKGLTKSLNFIKPKGKAATKRRHDKLYAELEEYIPPELMVKQDFPASLWIQANFLPTILTRISFMLQLEELRSTIAREKPGLGQEIVTIRKPLELDDYVLDYEPYIEEESADLPLSVPSSDILPGQITALRINQDYNDKLLESLYPWKDVEEPIDIDRTLEVCVMDIEHYETFISNPVTGDNREIRNTLSPKKQLALTYHKNFVPVEIQMLKTPLDTQGPELCEFYKALTSAKANDIVNLERLETLGDSFLKLITSIYIYVRFPQYNEGRATSLKGRIVSNRNLFYLAVKKNISGVIKFNELSKNDWLPPALAIPEIMLKRIERKEVSVNALFGLDLLSEEQISGNLSKDTIQEITEDQYAITDNEESSYQTMAPFFKSQYIGDKQVADAVESLLGLYFQSGGFRGGIKFIEWLGLIPESERMEERLREPPPNPLITHDDVANKIRIHLPLREEIENIIGYKFRNKAFLLQAMTHASYSPNRTTLSYEKLEFLGDAVLDFLITAHIYESCGNLDPGKLTDLRSALVNNNTFASLVVRLGLHKYLLMANVKLQKLIDKFVNFMEQKKYVIDDEVMILLQEDEILLAETVDIPKVLGDIFEAVAGAVYLDSNKDLKVVWDVFYKIMWKEIDLFSRNVPMNVVRKLFEWPNAHPKFGATMTTSNGRTMITLQFMVNGIHKNVHGFGTNKAMAKRAAAKLALQVLDVKDR